MTRRAVVWSLRGLAAAGVLALAAVLGWNLAHQHTGAAKKIVHGKVVAAPAFDLQRLDARGRLSLAALRGKVVVLNFWQSSCEPCKGEAPRIDAAARAWRNRGVVVVGVDTSEYAKAPVRAFMRHYGMRYPVVFDPTGTTAGDYGIYGTPTTLFVDRRGRVIPPRVVGPVTTSSLDDGIRRALAA